MICSIGVDVVEVERIQRLDERWGARFCNRVYTSTELSEASRRRVGRYEYLAGRFAVKEAVIKALRDHVSGSLGYRSIEVTQASSGRPQVSCQALGWSGHIDVSISHTHSMAMAACVAMRSND